jgi:dipeptidyl aminopeptidase/acylaminoacyl peptidase
MSVITPPIPTTQPPLLQPDPDALIKEARDRQRRRRRKVGLAALVLAAGVGTALGIVYGTGGGRSAVVRIANGPTVNVAAFAHQGRLAFVSRNSLWVVDGATRSLRKVATPAGLHPLRPSFSRDGKWLAFLETRTPPADVAGGALNYSQVWLAHGDGSDPHPVAGLGSAWLVGWSPTADVLAASAGPVSKRVPFESLTTLRVVTPGEPTRVLVRSRDVRDAVWSPDGRELAVVNEAPRLVDTLSVYPLAGGKPTVWATFRPHDHLNGMTQPLIDTAGWWKGLGIGVWVFGDGAGRNLDATPLDVIARPGAKPRFLADTLSVETTRIVASSSRGLALVADVSHGRNGGRVYWDAKQLQICGTTGTSPCQPIVTDRAKVTLDPVWSPNGKQLAFVEAPDRLQGGWGQNVLSKWYGQHVLRVYDLHTHRLRTVAAAKGATIPLWSASGKSLLYVDDDGVWLLPTLDAKPARIATPLFAPSSWPSYFGQIAWPSQLSWWSK